MTETISGTCDRCGTSIDREVFVSMSPHDGEVDRVDVQEPYCDACAAALIAAGPAECEICGGYTDNPPDCMGFVVCDDCLDDQEAEAQQVVHSEFDAQRKYEAWQAERVRAERDAPSPIYTMDNPPF